MPITETLTTPAPAKVHPHHTPLRRVTLAGLVAAAYFMVSGGPYGIEDVVASAGYARTLIILVLVPLMWSLPTVLMVAELSSAMPVDGGYYVWVKRALGPFWGVQEVWLTLASSVFDMAIYPTLFVAYLGRIAPNLTSGNRGFAVALAVVAAAVIWNLFGSKSVSTGSIGLGVLLLSPFAVLVGFAIHHHSVAPALHASAGADLLGGILVAMWNFMGWDNAANIGGEVKEAQRNYPRAMVITAVLDIITYVVPIAAMWYAHIPATAWETGAWPDLARTVGGSALAVGIVAGGMIMGGGMFNSLTMSYTRLPFVLAEDGFLPGLFTKLNRFGTPWVSLLVCAVGWALALRIGFEHLVQIDILLYGSALMLEFIAFAMLRLREPEMERPYRAPGGKIAAMLLGIGPLVLLVFALVHSESERIAGMPALAFGLILIAAGFALYPLLALHRARAYRG